jgi:hypothetical protein
MAITAAGHEPVVLPGSVADRKTTDGKDSVLYGGVRLARDLARGVSSMSAGP